MYKSMMFSLRRIMRSFSKPNSRFVPPFMFSSDYTQLDCQYPLSLSPFLVTMKPIKRVYLWGVWMWRTHLIYVNIKCFIFYRDWLFVLSEVWACECKTKIQKHLKPVCLSVSSGVCEKVIMWSDRALSTHGCLTVKLCQRCPANQRGQIYLISVVWDFLLPHWMLHVCQYFASRYVQKEGDNMYRFIGSCMPTV